jgi:predicted AlkP superfamily pyrophosphatase or phosphodiesterase
MGSTTAIGGPEEEAGLDEQAPVLPDYAGACTCNLVPALLDPDAERPPWLPSAAVEADQVVVLVLDGVGWHQLQRRAALAPTLTGMEGGPIRTVLPTTTATALTSITTGTPPGLHGVVGYRIPVDGEVLNILRWTTRRGDAREAIPPAKIQTLPCFGGQHPPAITRTEFQRSGFTGAHLDGIRFRGWRLASTLVTEVADLTGRGEPFVYAYYDGVDKVSHEYGLGAHFDAELAAADRLVADVLASVPAGTAVVVTADHGQVHVGQDATPLAPEVASHVELQTGEARFRWLHAVPGHQSALLESAEAAHGDRAWVRTRDQMIDEGWFGPVVTDAARERYGDVALVARGTAAFTEPTDTGPYHLVGRHGSATPAELDVPLLVATA